MRVALLILLMLVPTLLSATSYPFGVFKGTVRTVADGRFVYVELDPDYRPGSKGHGHWLRIEGGVEKGAGWAASGLYPADDPEHPVWIGSLDCLFRGQVFASRDGHVAVVLRDGMRPELKFYRDGLLLRSWRFPNARPLSNGTADSSLMQQCFISRVVTDQLWLTDYRRIDWYFSMSTGAYLGQSRASRPMPRPRVFASDEEIAEFEKALGGGEPVAPDEGRRMDAGNLAPPELPERGDEDSRSLSVSAAVTAIPVNWCISGCEPPFDADSVLSALSPRPRLSHDVFSVGDGRFVYAQIDETIQIEERFRPHEFPWQKSGLYRVDDPSNSLWETFLDLWMFDSLYVSNDGRKAAVVHLGHEPAVDFYFEGEPASRHSLTPPPDGRHASKTGSGGGLFSWWKQEVVDQFLVVTNRVGDEWWFLLRTGQLVRRGYGGYSPASDEEMKAFEEALGSDSVEPPAPDEGCLPVRGSKDEFAANSPALMPARPLNGAQSPWVWAAAGLLLLGSLRLSTAWPART